MAILIKTGLDTTGAKEDTSKLQNSLKGEIGTALQSVQAKADEAQKSLKGMLDIQKVQVAIGALGPLKSIVDGVGVSMLGLSESTAKAASKSLDMASQGAAMLSVFGPWGALIGGVGGAVLGYAGATEEAKKGTVEMSAAITQLTIDTAAASVAFSDLRSVNLSSLLGEIDKLQTAANKLNRIPLAIQQNLDELTEKATPKLIAAFEKAANIAEGDEFKLQTKNITQITEAYNKQQDALEELSEKLRGQAKDLKDLDTSRDSSGATLVSAQKDLASLTAQVAEAQRESDAYKGAIDDYTKSITTSTPKVQAHTKAIQDQAKAQKDIVVGVAGPTLTTEVDKFRAQAKALEQAQEEAFQRQEDLKLNAERGEQERQERLANLSMQRSLDAVEAQKRALEAVALEAEASAARIGAAFQNAFITVGVGAANALFDNLEAGRKPLEGLGNAFAKLASQQLRSIGSTLIGEGLKNELKAASLLILSAGANPQGYALAGVGAAEIAAGLAMGGAGALLGRRANKGASTSAPPDTGTSESLGSREAEAKGPQQLAPVKIYLGPEQGMAVFAGDQRGLSEYGKFTTSAQAIAAKAPR